MHRMYDGDDGASLGVCGYIRWEASAFKGYVQHLKGGMARIYGQQEAVLKLLGQVNGRSTRTTHLRS